MQYVIAFLEGIITFISPCLLPMLPIYVSYFAGGGERSTGKTLKTAFGFVLGFTLVSNMAAGVLPKKLSEEEVLEAAAAARDRFSSLVLACLEHLN